MAATRTHRRAIRGIGLVGVGLLAAQYVPSVVTLGQWTGLETLPADLCRWRGPRVGGRVALTFDDGPHPTATPAVLDRLDQLGLKATFFPLASMAERHRVILDEVVRRGHALGIHGYQHRHHLARSPRWVRRDLARAGATMDELGLRPTWYRPAYGQATAATLLAARARGWRTVLWSAWGREWTTDDPGQVAARVVSGLHPGAIALLHDSDAFGPTGMWRGACEALGPIAEELDRRRLQAVTLDELLDPAPHAPHAAQADHTDQAGHVA
jgi:peptidoglycan/xylan/chitin deacetylase (PgdA/CDA1 family)